MVAIRIILDKISFSYKTYYHILQTISKARRFEIDDTITRRYRRFNAKVMQLIARLLAPLTTTEFVSVIF